MVGSGKAGSEQPVAAETVAVVGGAACGAAAAAAGAGSGKGAAEVAASEAAEEAVVPAEPPAAAVAAAGVAAVPSAAVVAAASGLGQEAPGHPPGANTLAVTDTTTHVCNLSTGGCLVPMEPMGRGGKVKSNKVLREGASKI